MINKSIKWANHFRDASIRIKLILIINLSAIISLLMITLAITGFEYQTRKQHTIDDLSSIAEIISWNSSAALAFMDTKTAIQSLRVLETQPGKVAAFLYTPDGNLFADYQSGYKAEDEFNGKNVIARVKTQLIDELEPTQNQSTIEKILRHIPNFLDFFQQHPSRSEGSRYIQYDQNRQLHLIHPIFIDNELIGVLQLVDDQQEMNAFFSAFYLIISGIFILSLIMTLLMSTRLQRLFSAPLLNLMAAMQTVADEKKFTRKVVKTSNDEFGQLVDVYNAMLTEIHHRDQQLDEHREDLERQVKNRTNELTKTNSALQLAVTEALTAKEEAEAANLAKSQFLANMSHEIRTPMNAVLGMTDFLYESQLNQDQRHSIEIVQQSARLLLGVINDILDFSKIESGKLELDQHSFNCKELLSSSFVMLETQAKSKSLSYSMKLGELPLMLLGDSVRLSQILMNLLSNAIKFTAKGEVMLRAYTKTLPTTSDQFRLFCEVHDTGIGIAPSKQAIIFDSFSQADNSMTRAFGGTGLGLAIAKQLVRLMGGEIGVRSEIGKGATFWFWVDLQVSNAPPIPVNVLANCRFSAHILVAEDYPANQILVKRFLEGFGCRVDIVNNGLEALQAIHESRYDLVLMDCQMPVLDGYRATTEIRSIESKTITKKRLPIIALTAHALAGDRAKCLDAGMDEWVTKPFTRQDLNAVLQKWLPASLIVRPVDSNLKEPTPSPTPTPVEGQPKAAAESLDMNFLKQNFNLDDPDDLEFITSLKQAFQDNAEQAFVNLQQGIANNDSEQVRKIAHGLKSISANVGGMKLSNACKLLEELGRSNQMQKAAELATAMQTEYSALLNALEKVCAASHSLQ